MRILLLLMVLAGCASTDDFRHTGDFDESDGCMLTCDWCVNIGLLCAHTKEAEGTELGTKSKGEVEVNKP